MRLHDPSPADQPASPGRTAGRVRPREPLTAGVLEELARREREARQARLLLSATFELAGELDPERLCGRVADLAVRHFADCAIVDTRDQAGLLRRSAVRQVGGASSRRLWEALSDVRAFEPAAAETVLVHGAALHLRQGDDRLRDVLGCDAEALPDDLLPRECLVLPLRGGGRALGWLVLGALTERPPLSRDSLLAKAFTAHVGQVLDAALRHRLLEERLQASMYGNAADRRALIGMVHEFRTPLNAIVGYCDLLLEGVLEPLPEALHHYVRSVRSAALHQADLVGEVMALYRAADGDEADRSAVSIRAIARGSLALVEERARSRGLRLELDLPDESLRVAASAARLRQILVNLLDNAVKYTRQGTVELAIRSDGPETVLLEVRDTGVGIPEKDLLRVFDPYWRGRAEEGDEEGSGMGLSVVRRLVSLLDGTVSVRSEEGVGTTFTVALPRA